MRTKEVIGIIGSLAGLYAISNFAFSPEVRKKIFSRDKGQCVDCGRSFFDGWLVDCSHDAQVVGVPHNHQSPAYDEVTTGHLRCLEDHLKEDAADPNAVYLIGRRIKETGGRTKKWLEEHGQ